MKLKFSVGDKFGKTVLLSALGHSKFNYRGYRMKPHDQELHISGKSEYMYTDIKYVCTYNYGPWIIIVLEMWAFRYVCSSKICIQEKPWNSATHLS